MEFLELAKAILTGKWETFLAFLAPALTFVLPNKVVYTFFRGLGWFLTKFLRQKVGRNGEKVERWFQGTVDAAIRGLNDGLDADDKT